jgi:tRNA-specific 2-thiouridylase
LSLVDHAAFDFDDAGGLPVEVKIRYRHPAVAARLHITGASRGEIRFDNRGPAITPGQACVFYRGDDVVGGGFIERALDA